MTEPVAPEAHKPPTRHFDSAQQEAYLNLWRTYDRLRQLEDDLFSEFDLTAQQYNLLRILRAVRPGSIPTLELASRLVSRAPDITRMLDRVEAKKLIRRERPADNRRTVRVAIEDAGVRLLDQLRERVRDCHLRQLGHLAPERVAQLTELLREARAPHEPGGSVWS